MVLFVVAIAFGLAYAAKVSGLTISNLSTAVIPPKFVSSHDILRILGFCVQDNIAVIAIKSLIIALVIVLSAFAVTAIIVVTLQSVSDISDNNTLQYSANCVVCILQSL